jgi:hypothetical protein
MSTAKKIEWFGMKLTPKQKDKIRTLAVRRGVSQKQAVMELVDQAVDDQPIKAEPGSILERNRDLCGAGRGTHTEVATNAEGCLEKWGFGE